MSTTYQPVGWSIDSNIYEVNLRQYTAEGTFLAFEKELPRLKDMGIEILWFMPITPISKLKRLGSLGSYYACSDYTSTNPEFGSLDDFRNLVEVAHRLNMKVIIDWVANHTGCDHRWVTEHPGYYKLDANGNRYDAHGWDDVIDLDYDNPALREEMISDMMFWVREAAIDGFRCDMAMLVPLNFWEKARTILDAEKKLFWLAECEETDYHPVFDATYCWKFLHKMEAYSKGQTDLRGLEDVLDFYEQSFPENAMHAMFTSNHDENSHSGSEFVRLKELAVPFALFTCTWKSIPLIYSGQELPNKKSLKFFDKDPIEWTGTYELEEFYRKLLRLRKTSRAMAAIGTSVTRLVTNVDHKVFGFIRKGGEDEVIVLVNLSGESFGEVIIAEGQLSGQYTALFNESRGILRPGVPISLAAYGYEVFVSNKLL
ncbi:MAG: alpha-amylase family glycosyl hydrolase [Chitinophagaceae bacterium]